MLQIVLLLAPAKRGFTIKPMPRVSRHLRVGIVLILCALIGYVPLSTYAVANPTLSLVTVPQIFITELQTNGTSASEEFIELYNAGATDLDFSDTENDGANSWKLQFFSATSTTNGTPDWIKPTTSVTLSGISKTNDYYLLSATGYKPAGLDADQTFSSRLADSGGGIQLVKTLGTTTEVYDRIIWKQMSSSQDLPEGVIASPPQSGSLQRLPNDDREYLDSGGILGEMASAAVITPRGMWEEPEITAPIEPDPVAEEPAGEPNEPEEVAILVDNAGLAAPQLSEMLPNPASPQTDAADEYIELYNPNTAPFTLKGYTLQVGLTTVREFTFTNDEIMEPQAYVAYKVTDTKLPLVNSGSQVKLLDVNGEVVSSSDPYQTAGEGEAWALVDGMWQWTTTPTAGLANTITLAPVVQKPAAAAKAPKAAKAAKKSASKVKGTTSTKVKAKKATAKKKPKPAKAAAVARSEDTPPRTPIHTNVLVAVAGVALLYGLYEYRHDISNKFHQLRQHRAAGRNTGRQVAGWRGN